MEWIERKRGNMENPNTYATLAEAENYHRLRATPTWPMAVGNEVNDDAGDNVESTSGHNTGTGIENVEEVPEETPEEMPGEIPEKKPDASAPLQTKKLAALVRASDWLTTRVRWNGAQVRWDQPLAWPRQGVCLHGMPLPVDQIPPQVRDACCELAGHFMSSDPLAPQERGGRILAESVDSLSVTYAPDAPADTVFPVVSGLLQGLGSPERSDRAATCVELGRG